MGKTSRAFQRQFVAVVEVGGLPLTCLRSLLFCVGIVLLAVVGLWAAETVMISTLTRDGQVLVSLDLEGAYTEDIRSTVQSGLRTTFQYDVRLSREAAYWPDSTIGLATLAATVQYDGLIEQYNVARMVDGRVEETAIAEDEDEVRALLTRFERVPLFSTATLEPNGEYQVRVRVERRPRDSWFIWPFERAWASGVARFTFLP